MKEILFFLIKVFIAREGSPRQKRMNGKLIKIRIINSSRQHEEAVKRITKIEAA